MGIHWIKVIFSEDSAPCICQATSRAKYNPLISWIRIYSIYRIYIMRAACQRVCRFVSYLLSALYCALLDLLGCPEGGGDVFVWNGSLFRRTIWPIIPEVGPRNSFENLKLNMVLPNLPVTFSSCREYSNYATYLTVHPFFFVFFISLVE
jgi:hypothetical protein